RWWRPEVRPERTRHGLCGRAGEQAVRLVAVEGDRVAVRDGGVPADVDVADERIRRGGGGVVPDHAVAERSDGSTRRRPGEVRDDEVDRVVLIRDGAGERLTQRRI